MPNLPNELLEDISNSAIAGPKPGCKRMRGDGIVCVLYYWHMHLRRLVLVSSYSVQLGVPLRRGEQHLLSRMYRTLGTAVRVGFTAEPHAIRLVCSGCGVELNTSSYVWFVVPD